MNTTTRYTKQLDDHNNLLMISMISPTGILTDIYTVGYISKQGALICDNWFDHIMENDKRVSTITKHEYYKIRKSIINK